MNELLKEHEENCCCGHDHDHEEHHEEVVFDNSVENRVYIMEGLDCANCAAKIENRLRQLPEVKQLSITFSTKQLRVAADNQDALMIKMQEIINTMEEGVILVQKELARLKKRI